MNTIQRLGYHLFRMAFRGATIFLPKLSDRWAIQLFLKPMRAPYTNKAKRFIEECELLKIEVNGQIHVGYALGQGPTIICMHGWAGKTTQFAHIAQALANHGYRFVGFDAWAHGANDGNRASMFDFKYLLIAALNREKGCHAVIGHSLGASAVSLAALEGAIVPRFISMGAPVVGEDILDVFINRINGRKRHKKALRDECRRLFNREFDEVTMLHTFHSLRESQVLGIHGTEDIDADVKHLDILKKIHPSMITYKAEGLGHRRILKDKKVISKILDFLKK